MVSAALDAMPVETGCVLALGPSFLTFAHWSTHDGRHSVKSGLIQPCTCTYRMVYMDGFGGT